MSNLVARCALVLAVAAGAPAATGWQFEGGLPAGWVTNPDGQSWVTSGAFGPHAEIAFDLRVPAADADRLPFGLSAGDPAVERRQAVRLAIRPDGRLDGYEGTTTPALGAWPNGAALRVVLRLDRERGTLRVGAGEPGGELRWSGDLPWWNQVGFPDTVFVGSNLAAVRAVTVEDFPERARAPRLTVTALGPSAVRVMWSPVPGVEQYRLSRNGQPVTTLGEWSSVYLDREVAPRTRYDYQVEAVGAGASLARGVVTGPETEVLPTGGTWDLVVYGATPAGISAAVTLGRAGRKVALIEPEEAFGGMITGGLGRTDFGSIHALGGLFKEFMEAVRAHYTTVYGADSEAVKACRDGLYFEPHVARAIFAEWLAAQPSVQLMRRAHLVAARGLDGTVKSLVIEDRERFVRRILAAKVFIDATYEGDLAAYAGASYLIGREPREQFGEKYAGELWWDVWQRKVVDTPGRGDRVVQAYNYRLCLTRDVANRLPPPAPRHYDRQVYVGLLRDIAKGRLKTLEHILSILPLPNGKWDANNHPQGDPSSDLVGGADTYPEATFAERMALQERHKEHILGLLWFCRFDPEVPESLRLDAQQWGLARDEFPESDSWPSGLYVREGRRILGDEVFIERSAMAVPGGVRPPIHRDSIAVGAYPIDSHATGGRHPQNPDLLEGFFYLARGETQPYHIPFAVMVPQRLNNVIVACCVSSSHVGYGTLRMEPVFMALGLAAGLAAHHAIAENLPLRQLNVPWLQRDLVARGQVLTVFTDVGPDTPGREGFNVFGTFGAFPTYEAEPAKALTGAALVAWLRSTPWPSWAALAKALPNTEEPLPALAFNQTLQYLAAAHQLPVPPPLGGETVSRGDAMAGLWNLAARWLDRAGTGSRP